MTSPGGAEHSAAARPVEVPADVEVRVRSMCLALPEVAVRIDESRSPRRSVAYSYDIRRRSFCLLVAVAGSTRRSVPLVVLRADPGEREALLALGHPYFAPRGGRGRIGVLLSDATDWEETAELVIESYRTLAPRKLWAHLG